MASSGGVALLGTWRASSRRAPVRAAAADLVERLRPAAEVDPGAAPRGTVH